MSFNIGDEVFHKTAPSQKWIVLEVKDGKVHCSTLNKETLEQKHSWFQVSEIAKIDKTPSIIASSKPRRNNFW